MEENTEDEETPGEDENNIVITVASTSDLDTALQSINAIREKNGLRALKLDPLACTLAQERAEELAKSQVLTHVSPDGLKPYEYYFERGIRDHLEEVLWGCDDLITRPRNFDILIMSAHDEFENADEDPDPRSPAHIYMQRLLDAGHTHMGVGAYAVGDTFRFVEIFLDQYIEMDASTVEEFTGTDIVLSGQMLDDRYAPYGAVLYLSNPLGPLTGDDLKEMTGPYNDFTDEQIMVVWPWQFECSDGCFCLRLDLEDAMGEDCPDLTNGSIYAKIFVKGDPDTIPRTRTDGIQVPGEGSFCAVGWVFKALGPDVDDNSIMSNDMMSTGSKPMSLEQHQAKRSAMTSMSQPDLGCICEMIPVIGIATLPVPKGCYVSHYLSHTRQEDLSCPNMALNYKRDAHDREDDDSPLTVTDVVFVTTAPREEPSPPDGYELLPQSLLPKSSKASAEGDVFIAVKKEPAGATDALVDVAVICTDVVGAKGSLVDVDFEMGGGFVTTRFPEIMEKAYQATMFLSTKKQGAGAAAARSFNEFRLAEAQQGIEDELTTTAKSRRRHRSAAASPGEDAEDEFLDTSLTTEQIKEEEIRFQARAEERMRATEAKAWARKCKDTAKNLRRELVEAEQRQARIQEENLEMQRKILQLKYLQKLQGKERNGNGDRKEAEVHAQQSQEMTRAADSEAFHQYTETLITYRDSKVKHAKIASEFKIVSNEIERRLLSKTSKADAIAKSFRAFKDDIALQSENSRTSRPLSEKVLKEFNAMEKEKEEETQKVRLKSIDLQTRLRKAEATLQAKEQLAEGLHFIDFEQLKIENQTLNEKIEERYEELHKLHKKNTSNVQVLTHIREKLSFVTAENKMLGKELAELDAELSTERQTLTKSKREREAYRNTNNTLRQKQGFTNNDRLVMDFERCKQEVQSVREKISEYQQQYHDLHATVEANRTQLVQP